MGCCDNKDNEKLLCYCFNISENAYKKSLEVGQGEILENFVIFQTKHNYCNCEKLNPNKKCCLKEFKKIKNSFLVQK
ncbi:hypothetical protein MNB_SUP05-5-679 [hydrothermal vent metagenome]|uniref:CopZ zinc binding domain-containing protein n=1 Tax=hydrothermal vent metagenome TaxID=652676 RepID=A0A1W1C7F4_9ZZZZ